MVGEMEWQRGMDAVEQLEENGMPMRCQVIDTPGLLHRPHDQRNKIELLTVAALAWLPAYVLVFVLDLTDTATVSHSDQLELRAHVREQFAGSSNVQGWIDVVGKSDLQSAQVACSSLRELLVKEAHDGGQSKGPASALHVSCVKGDGLPELEQLLRSNLESVTSLKTSWWEQTRAN